ncbi:hypothetical protein THALO_200236 [Tenacibaculum halocynthiae]|nr:hypothetical protein DS884_07060 [Tenacibaculum sp. E3R01]SEE00703.1 hypothetical protein SAMN04487765_1082 [Tenacibaculum sp. MAR_2010_89]
MKNLLSIILFSISTIPLWLYIVDGYYQKNIKKGFHYILTFISIIIISFIMLSIYRLYFVFTLPLIIFIFIIQTKRKK